MTASELAALIVAISSVAVVVLLVFAVVSITRTLTTVRLSIEQLRRETLPVINDVARTVNTANIELERVDGLLDSAQSVTGTVDSASHLLYVAFSNPLVKAMAFAAGTGRAARALRKR